MEYRWYNSLSKSFLEDGYLLPNQTLDERIDIIANTAQTILENSGDGVPCRIKNFAQKFKTNMKKGWYSLSTPIWSNFGTDRGLPISCFGSFMDDNMESIAYTHAELMMMGKNGGGTSVYTGKIRSRGSEIKNNGLSSGSVHFTQLTDMVTKITNQGSTRRGNCAVYQDIFHKDIEEFLTIRSDGSPIQDIAFGVCIPDWWLKDMIAGDSDKRRIWAKVLECRQNIGFPYLFFSDNVNKNAPDVYKDLGQKIHASQMCFTGNQRVVTNKGIKTAKQLFEDNTEFTVFDNIKPISSTPMKLIRKNVEVFEIELSNGMTHTVTNDHKLVSKNGIKECKDLIIGDYLAIQYNKGIFGNIENPEEAFLLGLYQADGTQDEKNIHIDIWEKDFDIENEIYEAYTVIYSKYKDKFNKKQYQITKFNESNTGFSTVRKKRLSSSLLKKIGFNKGLVPDWIFESTENTQWKYIKGLFIADGTVNITKSKFGLLHLSLANIDKNFLQEIQIILANLGIKSSISLMRKAGKTLLPDGKGGHKLYNTADCYRLVINNKTDALVFEKNTGFLSRKKCFIEDRIYKDNTKKFYKIISITQKPNEDVYCCTVDSPEHLFCVNGFITHNCTEIALSSSPSESFVCDLSSLNILYYDEWKDDEEAIMILVYLLDAVITEFINKASKIKFMERAVNFAKNQRAIGIGWLGWHSLLQSRMIPFESMHAKLLNTQIAQHIEKKCLEASRILAQDYGEPHLLKGYGRRNVTLQAIAPTKSSSFILGQVSEGIEPVNSNYIVKNLAKGKFTLINPYLINLLAEKNLDVDEELDSVLKKAGSVQHLSCLNDHEKAVFKTFSEISPMEVIIQAAQRQKYIDQAQSINLMIHPDTPIKDINALILKAWELGVKTLYYQLSVNSAQEFSRNILSCSSCES